jgi:hypothetical protein
MLSRTTIRLALVAALAIVAVAAFAPSASAIADRDCSDFSTWRAAQKFYKKQGGPRSDRHRLDADRDGIACEELR